MSRPFARMPYWALFLDVPEAKWLWSSRAVSSLGDAVQLVVLLWLSSNAPTAGLAVGVIAFAATAPPVVIGPLLGAVVDRANRRALLVGAELARAAITMSIPVAYAAYGVWGAVFPTLIQASLGVLFSVTYTAALPEIVGQARLVQVNAMNATTGHISRVIGSALGGLLVTTSNLMLPFALNAATFVWSALMILGVPRERFVLVQTEKASEKYFAKLLAGVTYVRADKRLLLFIAIGALATIGFTPAPLALVMLANQVLGLDSSGYGLLQGLATAGLAAGAFLVGWIGQGRRKASLMAMGYIAMGIATLALGMSPALWFAASCVFLRSGFNSVLSIPGVSLLQSIIPAEARGRALTLVNTVQGFPRVVLLPFAGMLLDVLGVRETYALMATAIMLAGLVALAVRGILEPVEPTAAESRSV